MKEKLAQAREKGRGGWEQCDPVELSIMLREHVEKGDPRDVANFCMFLWHLGQPISDAALPYGKRAATVAEPSKRHVDEKGAQSSVTGFRAAVERMVTMLEEGEWAEHVAATTGKGDPLAQRLEDAITNLINEASGGAA